ncbi:MAG: rhomboid family intramembrane serine protease [Bacilli bacterium]
MDETVERKNLLTMKLLHYFITDLNYNPIVLQGVDNEIWLENLNGTYKIVRIVSDYIHNDEQMEFDLFKTKKVMSKIKYKTLSLHMNALSIYTDLGESAKIIKEKDIDSVYLYEEDDLKKYPEVMEAFPDITDKLEFTEEGLQLFVKITEDINNKNKTDAKKVDDVFKKKDPVVTKVLIGINILVFLYMTFSGNFDNYTNRFCVYGPLIRAGEYYRLITGIFLHGGILHLVFNMYALYIIGSQIEGFMGKTKYLIIYLFSGVMGSLLSITLGSYASVGASGAIFGLMGCLLYFGYHYRVYLGNVIKSQIIPLILFNLVMGFVMTGIDNFAHIGGLIGGILISIALGVKYKSSTFEKVNGWVVAIIFMAFLTYMALFYVH